MTSSEINAAISQATGLPGPFDSDLNACAEFERKMEWPVIQKYLDALWSIVGNTTASMQGFRDDQVGRFMFRVHCATALQRCQAFGAALNLWPA